MIVATALGATACSGPVDLTVVNPCPVDVRIQTYDGSLDRSGGWVPDGTPLADFVVPAGGEKTVKDALMFVTAPEEIRLVEPVERSFLISIVEDLDSDNRWTVPADACG